MHYVRLNAPFTVTQKLAILSVILSCSFALTNPLGIVKSRSPWLSKATTVTRATLPSLTPVCTERLVCTFHDTMVNMYEVCRATRKMFTALLSLLTAKGSFTLSARSMQIPTFFSSSFEGLDAQSCFPTRVDNKAQHERGSKPRPTQSETQVFHMFSQKYTDLHILFLLIWRTRHSVLFSLQSGWQSTAWVRIKPKTHAEWNTSHWMSG